MGGQPFLPLNIAALPDDLPNEISSEIIRGGAEKAREAGVVIAGGHVITSMAETGTLFIADGTPRRIEFQLQLRRVPDEDMVAA